METTPDGIEGWHLEQKQQVKVLWGRGGQGYEGRCNEICIYPPDAIMSDTGGRDGATVPDAFLIAVIAAILCVIPIGACSSHQASRIVIPLPARELLCFGFSHSRRHFSVSLAALVADACRPCLVEAQWTGTAQRDTQG